MAFSFSSSSFFFCFNWFSLLSRGLSKLKQMKALRDLQSNVIRVQHALNSSKFSCFLCLTLDKISETAYISKIPLTIAVSEERLEI